jgi:hypothetical protein
LGTTPPVRRRASLPAAGLSKRIVGGHEQIVLGKFH